METIALSTYFLFILVNFCVFKPHDRIESGLRGSAEGFSKFLDWTYVFGQFFEIIFLISIWFDSGFSEVFKLLFAGLIGAAILSKFTKNPVVNVLANILIIPLVIVLVFRTSWFGLLS